MKVSRKVVGGGRSSGSGSGTVQSVNGIGPDGSGNVEVFARNTIDFAAVVPTDRTWMLHNPVVTGSINLQGTAKLLIL